MEVYLDKKNKYMKSVLFLTTLILSEVVYGQHKATQLEILPYLKWDAYPSFTYPTSPVLNTTVKLKGLSWGITSSYKYPIANKLLARIGIGFYKYSFNHVTQHTDLFGTFNSREIIYDD